MQWRRQRQVLWLATGAALVIAWTIVALGHGPGAFSQRFLSPHHGAGGASFALAFASWITMMVAMMLPLTIPWVSVVAELADRRCSTGGLGPAAAFLAGVCTAWAAFAVLGAVAQQGLGRALPLGITGSGRHAAAAAIILAGAYQLSPLRAACLRHCRSPLGFFLSRWRDGPMGALELGLRHGAFCLGCCWALMALCLVLGTMNAAWMGLLTLVICLEQLARPGVWVGRALGGGLVAAGIGLLV
ncbi:MAG TPA: DUF2182 domain-containing protein [Gemmatimonadales bacterium]|nr:DUF2182 domain-containing protein [Gemmatimonadales bacterium]